MILDWGIEVFPVRAGSTYGVVRQERSTSKPLVDEILCT